MLTICILIAIIAYLIGSINFSVILSKKMAGFDVRAKGKRKCRNNKYASFCWKKSCCNYFNM